MTDPESPLSVPSNPPQTTGIAAASRPVLDAQAIDAGIDRHRIARRAYELWEARRDGRGHADADWFQAEMEEMVRRDELRKAREDGLVTQPADGLAGIR